MKHTMWQVRAHTKLACMPVGTRRIVDVGEGEIFLACDLVPDVPRGVRRIWRCLWRGQVVLTYESRLADRCKEI